MAAKSKVGGFTRNGSYGQEPAAPEVQKNGGLVTVDVVLTGVSPLLMNAMGRDEILNLHEKVRKAKNATRPKVREVAEAGLHLNADGKPHVPVTYFQAALKHAGRFVRLDGKKQVSTASTTVLWSFLSISSFDHPLYSPGTTKPATWDVDIQQGRNPNGGEAVAVIRPRFDEWEVRVTLELDQGEASLDMLRDLVTKAGKVSGFGDFRPNRGGTFGRFVISKWSAK